MRHALILAGGSGTRLWPLSTTSLPKQLAPLPDSSTLLSAALERAALVLPPENVWVVAGPHLAPALADLPLAPGHLVIEPAPRDTLPALALGVAAISASDPEAEVLVLTSDHVISPLESLRSTLEVGFSLLAPGVILTFGLVPTFPATAYGYLHLGAAAGPARRLTSFQEKPSLPLAQEFFTAGPESYLWNSGMFLFSAATFLSALTSFHPDAASTVLSLGSAWATPAWPAASSAWDTLPKTSVDYGVMEPASLTEDFTLLALPLPTSWLDVGSFPAYAELLPKDSSQNATSGDVLLLDSSENTVISTDPSHLLTLIGCTGLTLVHTPEATLLLPSSLAERVKELHGLVKTFRPQKA